MKAIDNLTLQLNQNKNTRDRDKTSRGCYMLQSTSTQKQPKAVDT